MNITVNKKIMLGFAVIIILMIAANVYTLYMLFTISSTTKSTLTSDVHSIDITKQLQTLLYEQERNAEKYWISRDKLYYNLFADDVILSNAAFDSLSALQVSQTEQLSIRHLKRTYAGYVTHVTRVSDRIEKIPAGNKQLPEQTMAADTLEMLQSSLNNFINHCQESIDYSMANIESMTTRSSNVALIFSVSTLLLAIVLAILIARTITKPIKALIRGTEQIVHGSFEPLAIPSHDEIGLLTTAVNKMSTQLKEDQEQRIELMNQTVHELRTPIQIIIAAHYSLKTKRAELSEDQYKRMLDLIRSGINRLTNFVNQLLDIAKIEAGKITYDFQPTDLSHLLKPIIESSRLIASQKDITINDNIDTLPQAMIDIEKISLVMNNLLSNAIKYTGRKGNVTVQASHSETDIRIAVKDTGIGIPPEDIPKLFTKFFQAANASQGSAKGTGLGLILVKTFTEAHGGSVTVESMLNSGTTFTVELPVMRNTKKEHTATGMSHPSAEQPVKFHEQHS